MSSVSTFDELAALDVKPLIRVEGGSLPQNVSDSERLLAEATLLDPPNGVFQRGGLLVRTARLPVATAADGISRAAGTLQILPACSDLLRLKLTEAIRFQRFDKRSKSWAATDAPVSVARTLGEAAGLWPNTPTLHGIVEAPTLRPDGSILDRPGYDLESGLYFDPGTTTFHSIPESVSRDEARRALDRLLGILGGFPFPDLSSRSVAVALLMTPFVRHAVRAAPLTAISAPKMASGKTLLAHLSAYIATGRPPALITQPETPEEERKRLLALLIEGSPVTVIDNCERPLKSDALCTALTEPVIRDRLLGSTRTVSAPTTTTWIATGNNLRIAGDLTSRTLLCMIDPRCERPEERNFGVNLHDEIPRRRGELAAAVLTIVRGYLLAECPAVNLPTFGRYEQWSRYVREPLVWLGLADPCESRRTIEATDPVRDQLGNLLEAWYAVFNDITQTVADVIENTSATSPSDDGQSLKAAVRAVAEDRGHVNPRRLGNFISHHERRIERGYRFERGATRKHAVLWSVLKMEGEL